MRRMRALAAAIPVFSISAIGGAFVQHAKGIALCLAACAKSDKPCQDRCVASRQIRDGAKACVADCRNQVASADFMVDMTKCIGGCLGEGIETQ